MCKNRYPSIRLPNNRPHPLHVFSLRIDIEPFIQFRRAVSDERAYADMTDPGMIWIGRHDNQMGPGKGSSIRQLLPEEAEKITRLLATEPDQSIVNAAKHAYPNPRGRITNTDGTPAEHLEIKRRPRAGDVLQYELSLNCDFARHFDKKDSLTKPLGRDYSVRDIDYASSEFPWGYMAGTCDFVVSQTEGGVRNRIWVFEFKRDWVNDDASIQVSLYVPWVVQTVMQFASKVPDLVVVHPVMVGRRLRPGTVVPETYRYHVIFNSGVSLDVVVQQPRYLEYEPRKLYDHGNRTYASQLRYRDRSDLLGGIRWTPPKGAVTTKVEVEWIKRSSWRRAKSSQS
ncbi:MAG: hypothetical protein ACTSYX_04590 [Candidatus Thorarchaeota archaeon]